VPENAAWVAAALPGWEVEGATLHVLRDAPRLPPVPPGSVRLLDAAEVPALDVPGELHEELLAAVRGGAAIAAALVEGRPVAFCYAGAETERWWDVAIDTLEPYRRQGHAGRWLRRLQRRLGAAGRAAGVRGGGRAGPLQPAGGGVSPSSSASPAATEPRDQAGRAAVSRAVKPTYARAAPSTAWSQMSWPPMGTSPKRSGLTNPSAARPR
jgi:hypothetical protein